MQQTWNIVIVPLNLLIGNVRDFISRGFTPRSNVLTTFAERNLNELLSKLTKLPADWQRWAGCCWQKTLNAALMNVWIFFPAKFSQNKQWKIFWIENLKDGWQVGVILRLRRNVSYYSEEQTDRIYSAL